MVDNFFHTGRGATRAPKKVEPDPNALRLWQEMWNIEGATARMMGVLRIALRSEAGAATVAGAAGAAGIALKNPSLAYPSLIACAGLVGAMLATYAAKRGYSRRSGDAMEKTIARFSKIMDRLRREDIEKHGVTLDATTLINEREENRRYPRKPATGQKKK